MGNENKVNQNNDSVKVDIGMFLQERMDSQIGPPQLYDLDYEFAETKHNKEIILKLAIFLFLIVIFFTTYLITDIANKGNSVTEVNIGEFTDVNLKEILDSAKKFENDLSMAKNKLKDIKKEQELKISEVNLNLDKDLEALKSLSISSNARSTKVNRIRRNANVEIYNINKKYNLMIEEQEQIIADIEARVADYDQRQINIAKKNEEIINNQQKLFDIEKKKLSNYYDAKLIEKDKNYYELRQYYQGLINIMNINKRKEYNRTVLKYNPIYRDEEFAIIVDKALLSQDPTDDNRLWLQNFEDTKFVLPQDTTTDDESSDIIIVTDIVNDTSLDMGIAITTDATADITVDIRPYPFMNNFYDEFESESIMTADEFNAIREATNNNSFLINRMKSISYINSVPNILDSITQYTNSIINKYETIIERYYLTLNNKNLIINYKDEEISMLQGKNAELTSELSELSPLTTFVDSIIGDNYDGFVIMKQQGDELISIPYIKDISKIKKNTKVIIYTENNKKIEQVGKGVITNSDGVLSFLEISADKNKSINQLDMIKIR